MNDRPTVSRETTGRIVVAEDTSGGQAFVGLCIGGVSEPTLILVLTDGSQSTWVASLCRYATHDEVAVYIEAMREHAAALQAQLDQNEAEFSR